MDVRTHETAARDYRSLREGAQALDLGGWTVLRVRGPDARAFLQGMASQDLDEPPPGAAATTFFLTEKGRPVAIAWVALDPSGTDAWILSDEGAREILRPHLERFHVMEDVMIEGPEGMPPVLGIGGPHRLARMREIEAGTPDLISIHAAPVSFLLRTVPLRNEASVHEADPSAAEAWRIAIGLPRTGVDFDLDRIATELSYPEAISLTKGCFVGQEVVARTSNRGQVRRRRVGFRFPWEGSPLGRGVELRSGVRVVGHVTSVAREPDGWLGASEASTTGAPESSFSGLGMGYLSTDATDPVPEVHAAQGDETTPVKIADWPL